MEQDEQMADPQSDWPRSRNRRGEPRTLTASEAAAVIGVSVATIRGWADRGRLPSHRTVGGHRRFEVEELKRWLEDRGAAVPAPRRLARRPPEIPACPKMARWLNSRTEQIVERVLAGYNRDVPPPIPAPSEPALRRGAVRYLRVVAAALDAGRASAIAGRAELAGYRGGVQGGAGASVIAEHLRYAVATIAEAEAGTASGEDFEPHALAALYAVIDRTQVAVVNGYVGARRGTGTRPEEG